MRSIQPFISGSSHWAKTLDKNPRIFALRQKATKLATKVLCMGKGLVASDQGAWSGATKRHQRIRIEINKVNGNAPIPSLDV